MRRTRFTSVSFAELSPATRVGWLLAATFCSLVALLAVAPSNALACETDGPCFSPVTNVQCPSASAGSTGNGGATFNVPKSARNLRYQILDQNTGAVYGSSNPICSGTTMSVQEQFTFGANEDQYNVLYTLTSNGSSNPSEFHDVVVVADWDIESDLGLTKEVVGDGPYAAESEIVFKLTVRNHGPGQSRGALIGDVFPQEGFLNAQFQITKIEQIEGTGATFIPPRPGDTGVLGTTPPIPAGGKVVVLIHGYAKRGGIVANQGAVRHLGDTKRVEPNPDPHPNTLDTITSPVNVQSVPDSSIKNAGATGVSGKSSEPPQVMRARAEGVDRVEVAIFKRTKGTQPFEGLLPERQPEKKGDCKWLKDLQGKFTGRQANAAGICDSLVWLKAKGTKRWRLELKDELGPGRYVAYSRAVGANDAGEGLFDATDGNLRAFKVK